MKKTNESVRISFERGRMANGVLTQTKVFSISSREAKLKPASTKLNKLTNRGKEDYNLRKRNEYRIVQTIIKKGNSLRGTLEIVVEKNGQVRIKKWEGNFCPHFSLI